MLTDWIQAVADALQAAVVVGSIIFAGIKYFAIRKSRARNAVVQMINLADEFPTIVSDEARYRVMIAQQKKLLANERALTCEDTVDEPNWAEMRDEVRNFRASFRDTLQALWSALDDTSLGWKKYQTATQDVLNGASNVEQSMSTLLDTLSGDDHSEVQQAKQSLAASLGRFTHSLAALAKRKNIMDVDEAEAYDPVLREYVKMPGIIKKRLEVNLDKMHNELKTLQSDDVANESTQLKTINDQLGNPKSRLFNCHLRDQAALELKKLAKNNQLIAIWMKALSDEFTQWIPDEEISQVRRNKYASNNKDVSQNTNDNEWAKDYLGKLRTQIVYDQLRKYTLSQYKGGFGIHRGFFKQDGTLSNAKGHPYYVVNEKFNKFLLAHPQVTVEDIFPDIMR